MRDFKKDPPKSKQKFVLILNDGCSSIIGYCSDEYLDGEEGEPLLEYTLNTVVGWFRLPDSYPIAFMERTVDA